MRTTRVVLYTAAALLAGCATTPRDPAAGATLESRSGSSSTGHVAFVEHAGAVRAHVELHGLVPGSEHGFHIHDKGDCSAPDAMSAGGHFNPGGAPHGRAGGDLDLDAVDGKLRHRPTPPPRRPAPRRAAG